MSPQEQAQQIAMKAEMCDAWHYANNPPARDRVNKTANAIMTALAASAAKADMLEGRLAEHDTCIAEIEKDRLAMVERENELHDEKDKKVDALTAKLEASERDRDSDRQSLMEVLKRLQESEAARGASEQRGKNEIERLGIVVKHYYDALQASERALLLPLMFHSGGVWTPEKSARWKEITGTEEATTKVMCDAIRAVLKFASPEARATGEGAP